MYKTKIEEELQLLEKAVNSDFVSNKKIFSHALKLLKRIKEEFIIPLKKQTHDLDLNIRAELNQSILLFDKIDSKKVINAGEDFLTHLPEKRKEINKRMSINDPATIEWKRAYEELKELHSEANETKKINDQTYDQLTKAINDGRKAIEILKPLYERITNIGNRFWKWNLKNILMHIWFSLLQWVFIILALILTFTSELLSSTAEKFITRNLIWTMIFIIIIFFIEFLFDDFFVSKWKDKSYKKQSIRLLKYIKTNLETYSVSKSELDTLTISISNWKK